MVYVVLSCCCVFNGGADDGVEDTAAVMASNEIPQLSVSCVRQVRNTFIHIAEPQVGVGMSEWCGGVQFPQFG